MLFAQRSRDDRFKNRSRETRGRRDICKSRDFCQSIVAFAHCQNFAGLSRMKTGGSEQIDRAFFWPELLKHSKRCLRQRLPPFPGLLTTPGSHGTDFRRSDVLLPSG